MLADEAELPPSRAFIRQRWDEAFAGVTVALAALREIYPFERDGMVPDNASLIEEALAHVERVYELLDDCAEDMTSELVQNVQTGVIRNQEQFDGSPEAGMHDKIELLKTICENPGWQPAGIQTQSLDRWLDELQHEGWVVSRLDGWEATPTALTCYPNFAMNEETLQVRATAPELPVRDGSGRPVETIPQAGGWDSMFKLPPIIVSDHQRVETAIDHGIIKGSVTLVNTAHLRDRQEVEITVRIRGVSS